jgi:hypothetical protein
MSKNIYSPHNVISIVSQLPPEVNGIGDYAFYLAEKLKSDFELETLFIRTEPSFSDTRQNQFKEELLPEKTSLALCHALEKYKPQCIILHYVGYAYSTRGCPFWLVNGIEQWKKSNPAVKVVTVFHELYASGKIWQSAFWLHIFQRQLVFRILRLSSGAITNTQITHNILTSGRDYIEDLLVIPVFSNAGEPRHMPDFKRRDNQLIIFGSEAKRNEIYSNSMASLLKWSDDLNIKKIIEIGPLRNEKVDGIRDLEIVQLGILSPSEISDILIQSKYGLLQYPLALLSKSGIFASYASHGVVPIVLGKHFMNYESDGIKSGIHYLYDAVSGIDNEGISKNIFEWYQGHHLGYLAARVFELIKKQEGVKD